MKSISRLVGATPRASAAVCLILAAFCCVEPASAVQTFQDTSCYTDCVGKAEIQVFPAWQANHPWCQVTAAGQALGLPPIVQLGGEDCYGSEAEERIAEVKVSYLGCDVIELYLVRTVGGVVEVDLIDLL